MSAREPSCSLSSGSLEGSPITAHGLPESHLGTTCACEASSLILRLSRRRITYANGRDTSMKPIQATTCTEYYYLTFESYVTVACSLGAWRCFSIATVGRRIKIGSFSTKKILSRPQRHGLLTIGSLDENSAADDQPTIARCVHLVRQSIYNQ